jgi:hypothetical protein
MAGIATTTGADMARTRTITTTAGTAITVVQAITVGPVVQVGPVGLAITVEVTTDRER